MNNTPSQIHNVSHTLLEFFKQTATNINPNRITNTLRYEQFNQLYQSLIETSTSSSVSDI